MAFDWQDLAALAVVFIAAAYIARHTWRSFAPAPRTSGCGHCSACPASQRIIQLAKYPSRNPKK